MVLPTPGECMRKSSERGSDSEVCDIEECSEPVKKSVSAKKAKDALKDLKFKDTGKKIHLCRKHYKDFKKATKESRSLERLGWE